MADEVLPEDPEKDPSPQVSLPLEKWSAVLQLMSVGTRHSDDTVLAIGGNLIAEIKSQLK